jgi:hypothetical protein
LDPKESRAHLGKAFVLRSRDPRAALAVANQALGLAPDFADALQFRTMIRANLGEADAERLARVIAPHRLYNAACAMSVLSQKPQEPRLEARALALLGQAVDAGFPSSQIATDPDLASFRGKPDFQALVAGAR